jgi:hypothetical protein
MSEPAEACSSQAMADDRCTELVVTALERAFLRLRPADVILDFYDNAFGENLFVTLECELERINKPQVLRQVSLAVRLNGSVPVVG